MTDYNDGKWHGWNGGECPVHPKSVVEVRFYMAYSEGPAAADNLDWDDPDCVIVAFRVVKPFREPQERWICGNWAYRSLAEAKAHHSEKLDTAPEIIHVREVLE